MRTVPACPPRRPLVPASFRTATAALAVGVVIATTGCGPVAGTGEPGMRASLSLPSENAIDCLARALGSVRLRDGSALRVDARSFAGTGTVSVRLPAREEVALAIRVSRDGESRASAQAWSRPVAGMRMEATLADATRRAVEACGGEVIEDRVGPRPPSRIG